MNTFLALDGTRWHWHIVLVEFTKSKKKTAQHTKFCCIQNDSIESQHYIRNIKSAVRKCCSASTAFCPRCRRCRRSSCCCWLLIIYQFDHQFRTCYRFHYNQSTRIARYLQLWSGQNSWKNPKKFLWKKQTIIHVHEQCKSVKRVTFEVDLYHSINGIVDRKMHAQRQWIPSKFAFCIVRTMQYLYSIHWEIVSRIYWGEE